MGPMKGFLYAIIVAIACLCFSFTAFSQAEDVKPPSPVQAVKVPKAGKGDAAPVLTDSQKLAILSAQHKRDLVVTQQDELAIQIADAEKRINSESQRLNAARQQADSDYKKETDAALVGIDPRKWKLNPESLQVEAIAEQPATATPSSSVKPASVDPVQQAKE
jgi:hypothetical protein